MLFTALSLPIAAFATGDRQSLYRSPFMLGRGEAGIADVDNEDAIFYNPAGLAQGNGIYKRTYFLSPMISASTVTRDVYRRVKIEEQETANVLLSTVGKNVHLGFQNFTGVMFRRVAFGVLSSQYVNILVAKSRRSGGLESAYGEFTSSQGFTFTLADKLFSSNFMLGTTIKYLPLHAQATYEVAAIDAGDIAGFQQGNTANAGSLAGADVGLMWHSSSKPKVKLGLTVANIGDTKVTSSVLDAPVEDLKQTVNLGFSFEPDSRTSSFKLHLDYRDVTGQVYDSVLERLNMGGQIALRSLGGFTCGLHQGYPSIGAYVDVRLVRVDMGMYTEEVGNYAGHRGDTRFFLRLAAGI